MKQAITFLLCFSFIGAQAQEKFVPYGKITFEKKINLQRSLENSRLPQEAREKVKKYQNSNWDLIFDQHRSLYKPGARADEEESRGFFLFSLSKPSNEIYSDYSQNRRVLKRSVMDDNYLLTDTIPVLNWKIMHELRTIAGYECRKAIGIIHDTVYVVAFYTDEILLRGGPEGFSGLPGMILGLAIPRYHTTWFATKVEAFTNHQAELIPATKGKRIETQKDLEKLLELFTRYEDDKKEKSEEVKKRLYGFTL